jgi:hypothetical protein
MLPHEVKCTLPPPFFRLTRSTKNVLCCLPSPTQVLTLLEVEGGAVRVRVYCPGDARTAEAQLTAAERQCLFGSGGWRLWWPNLVSAHMCSASTNHVMCGWRHINLLELCTSRRHHNV